MTVPPLSARSVSSRFSFQKAYRVENRSYSSLALLIKSNILLSVVAASEENFSLDQRTISYATARIENCFIGLQRILDRLHDAATTESRILDLISKAKLLYERFSTLYAFWNENLELTDLADRGGTVTHIPDSVTQT